MQLPKLQRTIDNGDSQSLEGRTKTSARPLSQREQAVCDTSDQPLLTPRFSLRQAQVVQRIALGLPDKQIAEELGISEETVAWHLRQMFASCGVHSRAALVNCCRPQGPAAS